MNRKTTHFPTPLALACALLLSPALAAAQAANTLPTGAQVTAGTASLQQAGNQLTIRQGSDRAIIDWRSFSIGSQAGVTFEQPSSSSVVLNRVLGSDPSRIAGSLRANGQVFLVNPNGVIFGQGARIDTQGLVASTLSITDDDFLNGRNRFTRSGSTAAVVNEGELHARYVALLAPEVRNEGAIVAERGTIALAGGEAVTLKLSGQDLVDIVVDPASIATLVENRRLVQADDGKVLIAAHSANGLLGAVINTGRIEANGIAADGGLVRIDASSRIELGGSVSADAGAQGKGGRIEVIADLARTDSQTLVSGSLSARGGAAGGDGGFIETSGSHLNIASETRVDTSAARGSFGQWLLDPTDFRIAASGGDMTGSALSAALKTSSVTIETRAAGTGLGDILVDDAISWTNNPGTTLTLKAHRNIEINARITVGSDSYLATVTQGTRPEDYDYGCHCYKDVTVNNLTGERLHLLAGQSGRGGFRVGSAGAVNTFYSGSGGYGKVLLGATASEVTVAGPLLAGYRSAGHILTAYVRPTNSEASSVYGDTQVLQYALFDAASGGNVLGVTASGTAGWSTTVNGQTNAGVYALSYTGGLSLSEYDILAGSAVNWTVKPKSLNLSGSKIYDGTANFLREGVLANNSYTLSGMVNGDAMPAPAEGFFTVSSANVGTYNTLAAGGAPTLLNPNYTLAGGSMELITYRRQTRITVTKEYDGSSIFNGGFTLSNPAPYAEAPAITGTLTGKAPIAGVVQSFSANLLQLDPAVAGNYAVNPIGLANITPKALTLTVSKTYDGSDAFGSGFVLTGMVGKEAAPDIYGWASTASANAGSYTGFASSSLVALDQNYTIGATTIIIAPKVLTVSATRVYDGTATLQSGFQLQGMLAGEAAPTVSGSSSISAANVASTAYAFGTSGLSLDNGNYILAASGRATITPKVLNLSVSKAYDGNASFVPGIGSFALSGVVGTETAPTLTGSASVSSANASSTAFSAFSSSTLALSDAPNYTLAGGTVSAFITPKALAVSVSKTYDGSASFSSGFTFTGMVGSEAAPTVSGAVSVSSANAGSYTGFASNPVLSDTNYSVGTVAALISRKELSISATRAYDGTTTLSSSTFKLEGMVAGQAAPKVSGIAGITGAGVASTAYTFGTGVMSLDNANYKLAVSGLATITPKVLNLSVSKVYDGNASFVAGTTAAPSASSFTLTGMVGTEAAPTLTGSASVSSANVSSTAYSAFISGATLAPSNANYTLVGGTVAASITPKPLAVTVSKTYDGNGQFTTGFKLSGQVSGEQLPTITSGTASVNGSTASATNPYTSFATNTLTLSSANYTTKGGLVKATIVPPVQLSDITAVWQQMISVGKAASLFSMDAQQKQIDLAIGNSFTSVNAQYAGFYKISLLFANDDKAKAMYREMSGSLASRTYLDAVTHYRIAMNATMSVYCPSCQAFTDADITRWLDAKVM